MPLRMRCSNPKCAGSHELVEVADDRARSCPSCGWQLSKELGSTLVDAPETLPPTEKLPWPAAAPSWTSLAELPVGAMFAERYQIVRKLDEGGMGAVYLAHDETLDRLVALKIPLLHADPEYLKRFQREARAGAQLTHDNICRVIDVNQFCGVPYLTMDYIDGRTLFQMVKEGGPVDQAEAVRIVGDVARALATAHERGIVHRDLKPSNIMIRKDARPIVMDFGLARRESDEPMTTAGASLGTPAYMPPEQVRGEVNAIGPRCDIYSLGVILYELLAGSRPFTGEIHAILMQILTVEPKPPSALRPGIDPRLEAICLKAMAKETGSRYRSMKEFAEALGGLDRPEGGPPPSPPGPVWKRLVVPLGAAGVLGIAGGVFLFRDALGLGGGGGAAGGDGGAEIRPLVASTGADPVAPPVPPPVPSTPAKAAAPPDDAKVVTPSGMELVRIKPGEFLMGSTHDQAEDEGPPHKVAITRAFYLGRNEVTRRQYEALAGENPAETPDRPDHPADKVSWLDAVNFCNLLSAKEGLPAFYKIDDDTVTVPDWGAPGYRLPTEAEWEYACRDGKATAYGFGGSEDDLGQYAWYKDNTKQDGVPQTAPVGTKKANRAGLFDMHGNAWEWCWDGYAPDYYQGRPDPDADPTGPEDAKARVLRGGAYNIAAINLRSTARHQDRPNFRGVGIGFRVARNAGP